MVATCLERDDEWQGADRRYLSAGSMARIGEPIGGGTSFKKIAWERIAVPEVHHLTGRNPHSSWIGVGFMRIGPYCSEDYSVGAFEVPPISMTARLLYALGGWHPRHPLPRET
jgi:hypothetical protein